MQRMDTTSRDHRLAGADLPIRRCLDRDGPDVSGAVGEPWRTIANTLFILSIAATRGPDHPTVDRSWELDPSAARVALALLDTSRPWPPALASLLDRVWNLLPDATAPGD
jgi:hypothetical protein